MVQLWSLWPLLLAVASLHSVPVGLGLGEDDAVGVAGVVVGGGGGGGGGCCCYCCWFGGDCGGYGDDRAGIGCYGSLQRVAAAVGGSYRLQQNLLQPQPPPQPPLLSVLTLN